VAGVQDTICLKLVGSCGVASHETKSDALGKYDSAEELALIQTLRTGEQACTYPIVPLFRVSAGGIPKALARILGAGEQTYSYPIVPLFRVSAGGYRTRRERCRVGSGGRIA
jgi:hypothetical protein